jgi:hypothetical protein
METQADENSGVISFRVRVASEKKQRLLGQLAKAGVVTDA